MRLSEGGVPVSLSCSTSTVVIPSLLNLGSALIPEYRARTLPVFYIYTLHPVYTLQDW